MEHKKRMKVSLCDGNIQSSLDSKREDRYSHDSSNHNHGHGHNLKSSNKAHLHDSVHHSGNGRQNQVGTVMLFGVPIVSLVMEGKERLCLAQISSTLLKEFSYNEIHNRRVALGITCIQCTPVQLEILRRAGAMPVTSRRCGMITRREAERLCQSFLGDHAPPQLPENFAFNVFHECAWGCRGAFVPARYNSSRAKCIRCSFCQLFFSPNKFIFHSHRLPDSHYVQPDAANFNSWRRHLKLCGDSADEVSSSTSSSSSFLIPPHGKDGIQPGKQSPLLTAQIVHAWEDVKAMFNGGTRKRLLAAQCTTPTSSGNVMKHSSPPVTPASTKMNSGSNGHGHANGQGHGNSSRAATPQSSRQQQHQHSHFLNHISSTGGIPACNSIGSTPPAFLSPVLPVNSPIPLLSPGGIWNPGLSPPKLGTCTPVPTMPLSIHPLSIPWLRRPLFPFSHPFGPTCKFGGDPAGGICGGETCGGGGINSSSAFKPVGGIRGPPAAASAEHLFSTWLNNSVAVANMTGIGVAVANSIPEDLSVNSSVIGTTTQVVLDTSSATSAHPIRKTTKDNSSGKITTTEVAKFPPSSPEVQSESSDEENVDIESTVEQFEGKNVTSSGPGWTTAAGKNTFVEEDEEIVDILENDGDSGTSAGMSPLPSTNHNNGTIDTNTNATRKLIASSTPGVKRSKKRIWDFDQRDD